MAKKYVTNLSSIDGAYSVVNYGKRFMIIPLQKSRKTGYCKVYLEIDFRIKTENGEGRKQKRVDTLLTVKPSNWSKAKERAKSDVDFINTQLDTISINADIYLKSLKDSAYSFALPSNIKEFEKRFEYAKQKNLVEFLDDFIISKQKNSGRNTWKSYRTLKGRLEKFQNHFKKTLYFQDINLPFGNTFRDFLFEVLKLNPNTVASTFSDFKAFMNYYHEDQQSFNVFITDDFKKGKFTSINMNLRWKAN